MDGQRAVKTPVDLLVAYCKVNNLFPPDFKLEPTRTTHTPRYQCTVQVGNAVFESPSDFACKSDARQSVARLALNSIHGGDDADPVHQIRGSRPDGDFQSAWGNLWMPYWTNYEILMERFRSLGGFTWTYVLNEVAKVNNLPVPLKFKFKGPENALHAQLTFLGRVFTHPYPKPTDREAKHEVCKLVVLSLLGQTRHRGVVQPTRVYLDGAKIGPPQVWHARQPTNATGSASNSDSSTTSRLLYAEVAKIKSPVPASAQVAHLGEQNQNQNQNDTGVWSDAQQSWQQAIQHHPAQPFGHAAPAQNANDSVVTATWPDAQQSWQHATPHYPTQSFGTPTAIASPGDSFRPLDRSTYSTPAPSPVTNNFMISFSTGGSDQTANVKSVEVASQGYLSFTEATHDSIRHADETSQTVPLFNISPDSSTSSQSSYHGSFLGMDDWNAQQDIQNDLPRFLPDLIGFPTLHSFDPSLLQATQTTAHTFFHHARLPPFPQLPQAPIPPSLSHLFAPQLHQHQSPITPPPHNTRTLGPPPAQDSPCSGYINIPPLHKPCLASSPVQPPYEVRPVSPAQPHHHPSQQSGAFPQTFTSFTSAPTEPPSLRLARLLRINYPYQPSPQYLQQQTVTGEMVATVTVGTLGTFVSKRRSGRIGMGEKEGEVSVGDLMEDAAAVALEQIRFNCM